MFSQIIFMAEVFYSTVQVHTGVPNKYKIKRLFLSNFPLLDTVHHLNLLQIPPTQGGAKASLQSVTSKQKCTNQSSDLQ